MQPIMNVTLISWDRDLCLLCWEVPTEVIKQSWSSGAVEPVKTPKLPEDIRQLQILDAQSPALAGTAGRHLVLPSSKHSGKPRVLADEKSPADCKPCVPCFDSGHARRF